MSDEKRDCGDDLCGGGVLCGVVNAQGLTGSAFTYQGRVTNGGVLVDGTINVQVSLWTDADSNAPGDRFAADDQAAAGKV